jgi:hypothetical protein
MKMHYKTPSGRISAEIEGPDQCALFQGIADFQEVFQADDPQGCGCCGSFDIIFRVREVDQNKFYELACRSCRARLSFGQHKKGGGLWPKRVDDKKRPLPNRGWAVYNGINGGDRARNAAR